MRPLKQATDEYRAKAWSRRMPPADLAKMRKGSSPDGPQMPKRERPHTGYSPARKPQAFNLDVDSTDVE